MPSEFVATACPHDCPSTCALEVERLAPDRIGAVRGARENDYTAGVICAKVARYAERVHHPGRLAQPLQRTGEKGAGAFRPIGWDDALDLIADAFVRATERHGPEAVWPYYYAGTMGLVQRDGIHRLRHVMGYSRQDDTICSRLSSDGWWAGVGTYMGSDPREMAKADLIVVWGCNPASTQVNVMTHIAKARKTRDAALVVVDPYETRTARVADHHVALRPGTDGALACGIMHVLFAEDFADRAYLARYTDCPEEFEAHLASRTPEWAAAITGIPAGEIVALARMIGRIKRTYIRLGYGFTRSRNGAANMHAASCIAAVTGAWQYEGGGAMHTNKSVYGIDATLIQGLDALDRSVRLLDMSRIGPVLTGDPADLGDGPPVTAIVMQNVNPAAVAPESARVREGLMREDLFLAVHEQFMTDTARYADIVLPATTFLEHDDIYVGGGHSYLLMGARVIEPYAEARSNHDVVCALAKRLGAAHPGFDMTAWELIDATLRRSGHPDAATLKAHALEGLHAGLRDRPSPERLRLAGRALPLQARLGADGAARDPDAGLPRPHGGDRRAGRRAPLPPRHRARAQLPQLELHRDPHQHRQGDAAERPLPPRRRPRPRLRRRRPHPHRQPAGLHPDPRAHRERQRPGQRHRQWPAARHRRRRERLAQHRLRGRARHQHADLGRARLPQRRRGLPRHRHLGPPCELGQIPTGRDRTRLPPPHPGPLLPEGRRGRRGRGVFVPPPPGRRGTGGGGGRRAAATP